MENKELKETLNVIILKIEQLSSKIDMLERKLAMGSSPAKPASPTSPATGVADIRQEIEAVRSQLMQKHQKHMSELKNSNKSMEGVHVLTNPAGKLSE